MEFLGFSYGFRPGRGAHDALDALAFGIGRRKVNWIVDADLRAYFDTIPRDWLMTFLEHRIGDRRVIRLISKWLNAGAMDDGSWVDTGMGTPQGAIVSPVLANVFLHYVLDLWFHKAWRRRIPTGEAIIVRYADDIVVGFQYKRDAEQYLRDVRERLARFGPWPPPRQDPPRGVRAVRCCEPTHTRGRQTGNLRLPGLHALLRDDQTRAVPAWSQADRETGQQDPPPHRRGAPQAMASRHLGGRRVAWAGRSRLAQLLRRPRVKPVPQYVLPPAETPVDARTAPAVPARPLQMDETGAHDQTLVAARVNPPPMAGPAVRRQSPEVGAGWFTDHVRICAGGAPARCIPTATERPDCPPVEPGPATEFVMRRRRPAFMRASACSSPLFLRRRSRHHLLLRLRERSPFTLQGYKGPYKHANAKQAVFENKRLSELSLQGKAISSSR